MKHKVRLSRDLVGVRNRFEAWRAARGKRRGRVPQTLWDLAVPLARVHGLSRTSNVLGVNYRVLEKHVAAGPVRRPRSKSKASSFVELLAPGVSVAAKRSDVTLEFEDARGAKVTVRLGDPSVLGDLVERLLLRRR